MRKQANTPKVWTKPQIRRLGEIKDVAGAETPLAQAVNNTKS